MTTRFTKAAILLIIGIMLLTGICGCNSTPTQTTETAATRTITDMYDRTVTIPTDVNKVLCSEPMTIPIVYMLAPDKLQGLVSPFSSTALVGDQYKNLPEVGGWYGPNEASYETFISMNPDIVFEGQQEFIEERQQRLGSIPVAGVSTWEYEQSVQYIDDWVRFMGDVLGVQDQAQSLVDYYDEAIQFVNDTLAQIPESERVTVYYAEGSDGLMTDTSGQNDAELIDVCGGINVADVTFKPGYGMAETSLEAIMVWDPDIIIIGRGTQEGLYQTIMSDSAWGQLRAVQNKQVYLRPSNPFSWFDGPPSTNQIIGLYWLVSKFYPEQTQQVDFNSKYKEFYSKFYHYELTDAELASLLANPE